MTETTEQEQEALNDAAVVHAFVTSDTGVRMFKRAHDQIMNEWKFAATAELREAAHSKFAALEEFATTLRAQVDAGKVVEQTQKVRERQAKQTSPKK